MKRAFTLFLILTGTFLAGNAQAGIVRTAVKGAKKAPHAAVKVLKSGKKVLL